jgi:GDPmannose 4,6-dehydratase
MRRALISGIAGQDGSYLAELLLESGAEVHGTVRPGASEASLWRLHGVRSRLHLHPVDLLDGRAVAALVRELAPHECYHLTGTRKVIADARAESELLEGAIGTTRTLLSALEAARPEAAFVFAASSEMFSPDRVGVCSEETPLDPRSIYAIAKAAGLHLTRLYRHKGLRASSAILFNHESPRRGEEFVSRSITSGAVRIKLGLAHELTLGDLEARRDFGHARSFARGLELMARQPLPQDLVLATGRTHSVGDFVKAAFGHLGLDWRAHVRLDPDRPRATRAGLVGDPSRARAVLAWSDEVPFEQLVAEMVDADMARATLADPCCTLPASGATR